MNNILTEISDILCKMYPPTHAVFYGIRKLNIYGTRIHHRNRKKELTDEDKHSLCDLLENLITMKLDEHEHNYSYYRDIIYQKVSKIL